MFKSIFFAHLCFTYREHLDQTLKFNFKNMAKKCSSSGDFPSRVGFVNITCWILDMGPFGHKRAIRASEPLVVTSQFSLRKKGVNWKEFV